MPRTLFQRSVQLARRTALRSAGERCVYEAGSESIELLAIPTKPTTSVDGQVAFILDADALDFLVDGQAIALIAGVSEPAAGHRIQRPTDESIEIYTVAPPADGVPCFERVDPTGAILRLHTKRTGG